MAQITLNNSATGETMLSEWWQTVRDNLDLLEETVNAIESDNIASGAVTTDKLAASSVTTAKLVASAVTAVKIAASAVTAEKIAASAVTSAKIADGAVTEAKIASEAVTTSNLAASAVTEDKIAAGAVTSTKIGDHAVNFRCMDEDAAMLCYTDNSRVDENGAVDGGSGIYRITSSDYFSDTLGYSSGTLMVLFDTDSVQQIFFPALDSEEQCAAGVRRYIFMRRYSNNNAELCTAWERIILVSADDDVALASDLSVLSTALDSKANVSDFNVYGYAGIDEIAADVQASVNGMSVSGTEITYTKNDGTSDSINTQDTTYDVATSDADGLMSARDKTQFDTNIPRVEEIHDAIVAQGYADGANDGGTEGVALFFADICSTLADLTSRVTALESGTSTSSGTSTASLEYGLSVSSEEPETGNWGQVEE